MCLFINSFIHSLYHVLFHSLIQLYIYFIIYLFTKSISHLTHSVARLFMVFIDAFTAVGQSNYLHTLK